MTAEQKPTEQEATKAFIEQASVQILAGMIASGELNKGGQRAKSVEEVAVIHAKNLARALGKKF